MDPLKEVAEELVEKIEYEEGVIESADWEFGTLESQKEQRAVYRRRQLQRDKSRAKSKLIAYKDSLDIVAKKLGMDTQSYLEHRKAAA